MNHALLSALGLIGLSFAVFAHAGPPPGAGGGWVKLVSHEYERDVPVTEKRLAVRGGKLALGLPSTIGADVVTTVENSNEDERRALLDKAAAAGGMLKARVAIQYGEFLRNVPMTSSATRCQPYRLPPVVTVTIGSLKLASNPRPDWLASEKKPMPMEECTRLALADGGFSYR